MRCINTALVLVDIMYKIKNPERVTSLEWKFGNLNPVKTRLVFWSMKIVKLKNLNVIL